MKKILFITTLFPPDNSVGTQRIVKFIKYLKYKQWDVHVLTLLEQHFSGQANNYAFYIPENINITRIDQVNLFNGIFSLWNQLRKIFRGNKHSTTSTERPGNSSVSANIEPRKSVFYEIKELVSNLLQFPDQYNGFSLNIFLKAYQIIKRHQIPYVFLSSPPHSPYIPLNFLRRWVKFTYVVDFRDPWALSQWEDEQNHLYEKVERKLEKRLEQKTLQRADIVIFNTEYLKREYQEYYSNGKITSKFHVITNGYDPELKKDVDSHHRINYDKIRILHAGTLYKKRNPQMIIEGLERFIKQFPQFKNKIEIRFVGNVSRELHFLYEYVNKECLASMVKFEPPVSYHQVVKETRNAHWLILLQPGTKIQIPAKLFDYLLVNKPIWGVLEKDSIGQKILDELNIGYFSDCNSLESVIAFFNFISSNTSWKTFQPDRKELEKYALPNLVDKFEKILLGNG